MTKLEEQRPQTSRSRQCAPPLPTYLSTLIDRLAAGLMAKSARKSTVKRKETPEQKAAKTAVRTTKAAAAKAAKATAAAAAKAPMPSADASYLARATNGLSKALRSRSGSRSGSRCSTIRATSRQSAPSAFASSMRGYVMMCSSS